MSVKSSHQLADQIVTQARELSAAQDAPITCRGAGCHWCCKEPVLVTKLEVEYALQHYPAEQMEDLVVKTRRWLTLAKTTGILREPNMGNANVLFYRLASLWCPFLTDQRCAVYEQRPAACRMHMAIGDPVICEDDYKRGKQQFGMICAEGHQAVYCEMTKEDDKVTLRDLDFLGCWLAEILLGVEVRSAQRLSFETRVEGNDIVLSIKS